MTDQPPLKLYTVQGIIIGTVIGSLAAGIFMIAMNYVALGSVSLAKKTAAVGISLFLILIGATLLFPTQNVGVTIAATILQALVAYAAAETLLGDSLRYHAGKNPTCLYSPLRAAAVGLITALVVFSLLVLATMVANAMGLIDIQERSVGA
ncbi:MAG: hypothetical protein O3A63_12860 [Proteobacteria bacterium]|nr:hypothetical protein [Pseudomonadota bacterium]